VSNYLCRLASVALQLWCC